MKLKYRTVKMFKYITLEEYRHKTPFHHMAAKAPLVELAHDGTLIISPGFFWDGASGPTVDTQDSMRGSLVHDALYFLMRLGLIPIEAKQEADRLLEVICIEDGMSPIRARAWYDAVTVAALRCATEPQPPDEIYEVGT